MSPIHLQADTTNGWTEWSRHVLKTLEDQSIDIKEIRDTIGDIKIDIATLKVKSGVWGAIGGLIPVLIAILFWVMER